MRIISGSFKGRHLKTPSSNRTRPTTDIARESIFNILRNKIDFDGLSVLDLFCGTGSFGLECISRGAGQVVFVDKFTKTIDENVSLLKTEGCSEVFRCNVFDFLRKNDLSKFDLIFADPPYAFKKYFDLLDFISKSNSYFILEHSEKIEFSPEISEFLFLEKKIGISLFSFFNFKK
jgi:16S rRNA (guanine966-N2)-methyltransferase